MVDYKEKECFTNNRREEPCSAGLYAFKKGNTLLGLTILNNKENYLINNELYISMLIKALIEKSYKVGIKNTTHFAQLGTPQDYADHKIWVKNALTIKENSSEIFNRNIECNFLMLIGGKNNRFKKDGFKTHKTLLSINKISVFERALTSLPNFSNYFIALSNEFKAIEKDLNNIAKNINVNLKIFNKRDKRTS